LIPSDKVEVFVAGLEMSAAYHHEISIKKRTDTQHTFQSKVCRSFPGHSCHSESRSYYWQYQQAKVLASLGQQHPNLPQQMQSVRNLWRKVNIFAVPYQTIHYNHIQVRPRRTKSASWRQQDASNFDRDYQFSSSSEGTCDEHSLPDPSPKDEEIVAQYALRLPLDVITIILEYLDARTLVICREVSLKYYYIPFVQSCMKM
jgi:hypothetical protein